MDTKIEKELSERLNQDFLFKFLVFVFKIKICLSLHYRYKFITCTGLPNHFGMTAQRVF